VEWVETTGRTIEEAKDAALDQLGVDEAEAEFEVLEEPRVGLFGRLRGEARIRARIEPARPRPKNERRDRGRRREKSKGGGEAKAGSGADTGADEPVGEAAGDTASSGSSGSSRDGGRSERSSSGRRRGSRGGQKAPAAGENSGRSTSSGRPPASGRKSAPVARSAGDTADAGTVEVVASADAPRREVENEAKRSADSAGEGRTPVDDDVTVEQQADLTEEFLTGLLDSFGLTGTLDRQVIDEETIELDVKGDDLGLLIGPKGQTLLAVQDLARTYVQRKATGHHEGRVRIDIGGYRQRRRDALQRFTRQVATEVVESGVQKALEPMVASDRKVVHDEVNLIEGVRTISEGEDPRRRVVIIPE
jgi:spoIIIJ-associated protein